MTYAPKTHPAQEPTRTDGEMTTPLGTPRSTGLDPEEQMSVPALLRKLMDDLAHLFRKELALASAEVLGAVEDTKRGAGALVGGGAVLYGGVLVLLGAATLGLAEVMPAWGAALIVGLVVTVIGAVMVSAGKKKLSPGSFAPERAMDSLQKDKDTIERRMS